MMLLVWIEYLAGLVFAYLAISQVILPAIRGTKWFPMLYPHHRVLESERRVVLTQMDDAALAKEIRDLNNRLRTLEGESDTAAPPTPEAPQGPEVKSSL